MRWDELIRIADELDKKPKMRTPKNVIKSELLGGVRDIGYRLTGSKWCKRKIRIVARNLEVIYTDSAVYASPEAYRIFETYSPSKSRI